MSGWYRQEMAEEEGQAGGDGVDGRGRTLLWLALGCGAAAVAATLYLFCKSVARRGEEQRRARLAVLAGKPALSATVAAAAEGRRRFDVEAAAEVGQVAGCADPDGSRGVDGSRCAPGVLGSPFAAAAMGLSNPLGYGGADGAIAGMTGLPGAVGLGSGGGGAFGGPQMGGPAGLRFGGGCAAAGVGGSVLLVSNLEESQTDVDHLFTLFGVYGDVQRVKILFNKKDTALVQLAEPQQALLAMTHLDKVRLWSKQVRVMPSKHTSVQLPKEGQPDAGLTKDYSNSSLHRYKKAGSKNYSNICPPSATLHLSNIPASVEEDDLRSAFADVGGVEVQAFKFFPKDRKMALVQLAGVDDAVTALVRMHNHQLSETSHLRVSFSKSTI